MMSCPNCLFAIVECYSEANFLASVPLRYSRVMSKRVHSIALSCLHESAHNTLVGPETFYLL